MLNSRFPPLLKLLILTFGLFSLFYFLRLGQPIYSDEVSYFMTANRYLVEGGRQWHVYPMCELSSSYNIPLIWKGFAYARGYLLETFLYRISNIDYFFSIRAVIVCLCFFFLVEKFLPKKTSFTGGKSVLRFMLLIGTIPTFLVMGRHDVTLLILLLLSLLCLVGVRLDNLLFERVRAIFLVGLFLYGVSLHPQFLPFVVFYLAAICLNRKLGVFFRSVLVLGLFYISLRSAFAWSEYLACPEQPNFKEIFESQSVNPVNLLRGSEAYFKMLKFFEEFLLMPIYQQFFSSYPYEMISVNRQIPTQVIYFGNFCLFVFGFFIIFELFQNLIKLLVSRDQLMKEYHLRKEFFIFLSFLFSILAWSVLRAKFLYNSPFMFGGLAASYIFSLRLLSTTDCKQSFFASAREKVPYLFVITIMSSISLCAYQSGKLGLDVERPSYNGRSLANYRTPELNNIDFHEKLKDLCSLGTVPLGNHLLVDEITQYFVWERSRLVTHLDHLLNEEEKVEYINKLKISHYFRQCKYLKDFSTDSIYQEKGYCCGRIKEYRG